MKPETKGMKMQTSEEEDYILTFVPKEFRNYIIEGYPKTYPQKDNDLQDTRSSFTPEKLDPVLNEDPKTYHYKSTTLTLTKLYLAFPDNSIIFLYKCSTNPKVYFKYGMLKNFWEEISFLSNSKNAKTFDEAIVEAKNLVLAQ